MSLEDYKNSPEHGECIERMGFELMNRMYHASSGVNEIIDAALHEVFEYGYYCGKYDEETGQ